MISSGEARSAMETTPTDGGPAGSRNRREWELYGEYDPFWAVAAWGGQKDSSKAWTAEDFYATGEADWAVWKAFWAKHGLDTDSVVEIGSGAGRCTKALAATFGRVEAIDVSQGMIDTARKYVDATNVTYHLTQGLQIPLPTGSVSAAFSTLVFQHLDTHQEASTYLAEVVRVLKPGGSLMIQFPAYEWPTESAALELVFAARTKVADLRANALRRMHAKRDHIPVMRGLSFPMELLFGEMDKLGMINAQVTTLRAASVDMRQAFLLATKA